MSIKRKLILITLIFSTLIILLMSMNYFVMSTLSTVRAYVAGEAFYSKGQKDATYFLARYTRTQREEEYQLFLNNIKIPIGDRIAREELLKDDTNYSIVDMALIQAKNDPSETRDVALLFKRFGWISYFKKSLDFWTQGDEKVKELVLLADEIHSYSLQGKLTPEIADNYLIRIDKLNQELTFLEEQYSNILGKGVRWVTSTLFYISFAIMSLGFIFAILVAFKIAKNILHNIESLQLGTIRLEKGILTTPIEIDEKKDSKDELIQLAISFNKMTESLNKAINERNIANEKLELRARQLSEAQELAHVGSWELDTTTFAFSASDEFYRIYGFNSNHIVSPDDLIRKIHPTDQESLKNELNYTLIHHVPFHYDYKIMLDDGSTRELTQHGRPIVKDGKVIKLIGSTQDITERSNVQLQLLQSSKMASLGEMASGIAHEINNPLAIIKMSALQLQRNVIIENPDVSNLQNTIAKIDTTVDRISKIIQGLRTFSRDGRNDPFEIVPLDSLLDDILSFCHERLKDHSIALKKENLGPDLNFKGRKSEISQVLLNLLNNSIDAIAELDDKWIKIEAKESDNFLNIRITDSGPRVSPEIQEKMFQPFFTSKEIGKGTGLGLSVSLTIVKNHQGELFLDTENSNTSFVLRLPLKKG